MTIRVDLHINAIAHAKPSKSFPERHAFATTLPVTSAQNDISAFCERVTCFVTYTSASSTVVARHDR
jgi:hypothetical protein